MDVCLTKHNESYAKIEYANISVATNISEYFSYFADNYKFNPKFKYSSWDGKIRMFNKTSGLLPLGLMSMFPAFLEDHGYDADCDPVDLIAPSNKIDSETLRAYAKDFECYSDDERITPHWYQVDSFVYAMTKQRGILNLPTSAGKSLIQAMISRYYLDEIRDDDKIVMLIVPKIGLISQMGDDFKDYKTFTRDEMQYIMGGEEKEIQRDTKIVISTWQSAINLPPDFYARVGMVICDEAHLAEGKSIQKICLEYCNNVEYKIGLTGSLKDGKSSILLLRGIFAGVFKPTNTSEMIGEGKASKMKIKAIQVEYPDEIRQKFKSLKVKYPVEIKWLEENEKRTKLLANLAVKSVANDDNTLVLFQHQLHGEAIFNAIKELGHEDVVLIHGRVKNIKKIEGTIRERAENSKGMIIVASYTKYSTGVSIKRLQHVILGSPLKSKITIMQSIGRGLRKHKDKEFVTLWDVFDDLSIKNTRKNAKRKYSYLNYGMQHFLSRVSLYIEEKHDYTIKKWKI